MVFVVAEIIDDHDDTNDYIVNFVAMTVEESTMYYNCVLQCLSDAVVIYLFVVDDAIDGLR